MGTGTADRAVTGRFLATAPVAAAVTPLAVTAYASLAAAGGAYSLDASLTQTVLAALSLGELGVLAVFGRRVGLPVSAVSAVGALLALPWLFPVVPGESRAATGYAVLTVVAVGFVTGTEVIARHRHRVRSVLRSADGRIALVAGVGHALFAVGTGVFARGTGLLPFVAAVGSVSVFLLFAVTVVGWVMYRTYDLRAPVLLLVGWIGAGVFELAAKPLVRPRISGVNWTALPPTAAYLTTGGVLLVMFVAVAGCEWYGRRLVGLTGVADRSTRPDG